MQNNEMKKNSVFVGIISYNIHSYHLNYGAVLHTYAFQKYLCDHNVKSVVIDYVPKSLQRYCFKYPLLNCLRIRNPIAFLRNLLNWSLGFFSNIKKYNKFQQFFSAHYIKTERSYFYKELRSLQKIENLPFTTFVCESDVIWKLYGKEGFDEVFFLDIPAACNKIKVSYAPSISARKLSLEEQEQLRGLTKDFIGISCRDKEGAIYLSEVLSRHVEWCLDPTLLLNSEDYESIAIKPKENRYLLVYNCVLNDRDMVKEAYKLADRLGLKVIEISNYSVNKLSFSHVVKTDLGIEEFLGYFKYADFVICNSFHGCCFSVLFRKQFFLFQRDSSDFRMKSITEGLGCNERMIPYDNKIIPAFYSPIDYDLVYERLANLREISFNYINKYIIA